MEVNDISRGLNLSPTAFVFDMGGGLELKWWGI